MFPIVLLVYKRIKENALIFQVSTALPYLQIDALRLEEDRALAVYRILALDASFDARCLRDDEVVHLSAID